MGLKRPYDSFIRETAAIRSVHEMDANLRTYVTPTYLDLPSPVGSVSTRINFLAAKLFEASDGAFLAGRDIYQVFEHIKMMLNYKS